MPCWTSGKMRWSKPDVSTTGLNVLSDRTKDKAAYRDDGFARYLSGILYESTGDLNNAFIAYRKAYETFEATRAWSRTGVPAQLRADLLRTAEALHLSQELTEYQHLFPDTTWESVAGVSNSSLKWL